MLFNSHEFIFFFLPLAFVLFWYGGRSLRWRLGFLTVASYVFYSWWQFDSLNEVLFTFRIHDLADLRHSLWKWRFTLLILSSSSVDYFAAKRITRTPIEKKGQRKALLALSLIVNLGLLGFFKYFGFFESVVADLVRFAGGGPIPVVAMVLPVGISFYTFESISYVVDIYRGVATPARSYLDYACFISFFPHLVAGPIIRYSDILHQFRDVDWVKKGAGWDHIATGLMFLAMGMGKKLLIADELATGIAPLWQALGDGVHLGVKGSWAAVLGYTFRIYFDFSGYSDMAIGLGHLFAVKLPQNFNSPYQATDPTDFWRRWHISLSSWLRDYLYIPLGGNRNGKQLRNLVITMLLGGLWHGAAWLFIVWGAWHGLLLVVFHALKKRKLVPSNDRPLGHWFNRQLTFLLVVVGWVFFRAADVHTGSFGVASVRPAFSLLGQMVGTHGFAPGAGAPALAARLWPLMLMSWLWCNFLPNSSQLAERVRATRWQAALAGVTLAVCVLRFGLSVDFLYFRF
jgi:alginate O-acetyltransferase complex protein AlgI